MTSCSLINTYKHILLEYTYIYVVGGPGVATSWTVPGLIPGDVTWDFFRGSPPAELCALGSTHPLKMSTRDISWGKGGRCVWQTTYHPCSAERQENPGP